MTAWEAFSYGVLGGALVEVATLFKLRQETVLPAYLRSRFYWAMTLMMIAAGGVLAFVHLMSGNDMKAWLVMNVGASAPLLIGSLVTPPKVN